MVDYALSAKARDAIQKIVAKEIQRQQPPTRIAQVKTVDPTNKTLGVTFTGETNVVSVPYVSEVPANLGQYVRIGGGTHDRYVEAVIGETLTQRRVERSEGHIDTLMENVVGPGWDEVDPDELPTSVLGYFDGVDTSIGNAQSAANAAQGDVNVARSNLAGFPSLDPTQNVGHEEIFDNSAFIGYSKCYYIAFTLADYTVGSGKKELAALGITAYNGMQVNQIAPDGRYSITILSSGYYEFNCATQFGSGSGNYRRMYIELSTGTRLIEGSSPAGTFATAPISGATVYLEAGQTIRFYEDNDGGTSTIVAAMGTYISVKQISFAAPAAAIGTLDSNVSVSFSRDIIMPLRNNSGGFWAGGKVKSPIALTLGNVLCKIRYGGGSGRLYLMRNGVAIGTHFNPLPYTITKTFVYTGPIATTDEFWIEGDATGNYYANDTFIRISGT